MRAVCPCYASAWPAILRFGFNRGEIMRRLGASVQAAAGLLSPGFGAAAQMPRATDVETQIMSSACCIGRRTFLTGVAAATIFPVPGPTTCGAEERSTP